MKRWVITLKNNVFKRLTCNYPAFVWYLKSFSTSVSLNSSAHRAFLHWTYSVIWRSHLKSELCWVGVSVILQGLIFSLQRHLKQSASNNDNFLPHQSSCHRLWVIHRHPTVYQSHGCNARTWVRQSAEQTVNNVHWYWIWMLMLSF